MSYIIGIDGGGTKTTCLFHEIDESCDLIQGEEKVTVGPGTNPRVIGFEEMGKRLHQLIRQGMKDYNIHSSEIRSIGCGLAGVGRVEEEKKVTEILKSLLVDLEISEYCNLYICSDSLIALRGALPPGEEEGVLIISGTGSNAIGMTTSGEIYRCGGWGHIIGDEGSGYRISLKALTEIARAQDRRSRKTLLTELILAELNLQHPEELIHYIYGDKPGKNELASLTRQVIRAADQEDSTAKKILIEAADELVLHVESIFKQSRTFHSTTPVSAIGSVFKHSEILKSHFLKQLKAKGLGRFKEPYRSPEYGAMVLAKKIIQHSSGE